MNINQIQNLNFKHLNFPNVLYSSHLFIVLCLFVTLKLTAQGVYEKNKRVKFEKFKGNEIDIKNYLDTAIVDPLEGIWTINFQGTIDGEYFEIQNYIKYAVVRDVNSKTREFMLIFLGSSDRDIESTSGLKPLFLMGEIQSTAELGYYVTNSYKTANEIEGVPLSSNLLLLDKITSISSYEFWSKGFKWKVSELGIRLYPKTGKVVDVTPNIGLAKGTATGFFVNGNGVLATNYHVIKDAQNISVNFFFNDEKRSLDAHVIAIDSINDLALLQIDFASFHNEFNLPYAIFENAEIGDHCFTLGYPYVNEMGFNIKLTDGVVSAKCGLGDSENVYQISVPIMHGNSGGPLFNDYGNVIGITSGGFRQKQSENVNYAIKAKYLISLLHDSNIPYNSNGNLILNSMSEHSKILKNYVCLLEVEF